MAERLPNGTGIKYQGQAMQAPREGVIAVSEDLGYRLVSGELVPWSYWTEQVQAAGKSPAPVATAGKRKSTLTASKVCVDCGKTYAPTSNVQKRCPE